MQQAETLETFLLLQVGHGASSERKFIRLIMNQRS